jgi:thiamine transporter
MVLTRRRELVELTEAAVAVALSVLLGNLRLVELPAGGSIALATLPLLALAAARGVRPALLAGTCAGAGHALAGGTIIHPAQAVLDYGLAYAALAAAGIAAGRPPTRGRLVAPILLAMSLHLAAMVASGVIFFSTVAPDAALAYALAYNAVTVVPEALLAIWLVPPLVLALARADPADSWRRGLLDAPRRLPRSPRAYRPIEARMTIDMLDVNCAPSVMRLIPRPADPLRIATRRSQPARVDAQPATLVRAAPFAARRWSGSR